MSPRPPAGGGDRLRGAVVSRAALSQRAVGTPGSLSQCQARLVGSPHCGGVRRGCARCRHKQWAPQVPSASARHRWWALQLPRGVRSECPRLCHKQWAPEGCEVRLCPLTCLGAARPWHQQQGGAGGAEAPPPPGSGCCRARPGEARAGERGVATVRGWLSGGPGGCALTPADGGGTQHYCWLPGCLRRLVRAP